MNTNQTTNAKKQQQQKANRHHKPDTRSERADGLLDVVPTQLGDRLCFRVESEHARCLASSPAEEATNEPKYTSTNKAQSEQT